MSHYFGNFPQNLLATRGGHQVRAPSRKLSPMSKNPSAWAQEETVSGPRASRNAWKGRAAAGGTGAMTQRQDPKRLLSMGCSLDKRVQWLLKAFFSRPFRHVPSPLLGHAPLTQLLVIPQAVVPCHFPREALPHSLTVLRPVIMHSKATLLFCSIYRNWNQIICNSHLSCSVMYSPPEQHNA